MARKKLKKIVIRWMIFIFLITCALYWHKALIRFGYKVYRYQQTSSHRNLANQLNFPENYKVHGIDISRYQPDVNWNKLKAVDVDKDTITFQFTFIKATEGIFWEDPLFKDNWDNAQEHHIIRGAYHYFKPASSPKMQAINFINSVDLKRGDLPPVVDIEETQGRSKKELVNSLKQFVLAIEEHYKVKPIIYSNISFIEDYLADDFGSYSFWVAHFYVDELKISNDINWLFWQHHDKAHLLNSSSNFDVNVFKGNKTELKKILVQ